MVRRGDPANPGQVGCPTASGNGGTVLRQVGQLLESVDDVLTNAQLLAGKTPAQVAAVIGRTPGWVAGTMLRGRSAGGRWIMRQMNSRGTDYTDKYIQWSSGSPRHFGGRPCWEVPGGTVWVRQ